MSDGGGRQDLLKLLVEENYIASSDADAARSYAETHTGSALDYLLQEEVISKDILGQAVAEKHRIPYADLASVTIDDELLQLMPSDIAVKWRAVPFRLQGKTLVVASDEVRSPEALKEISESLPEYKITFAYGLSEEIDQLLLNYQKPLTSRLQEIIDESGRVAADLIDQVLIEAINLEVSDIHFEPLRDSVMIRFRIDGRLHEAGTFSKDQFQSLMNRIKILSNVRIDEHTRAQDGAIHFQHNGEDIDMRVSIVPTLHGEKVVLRLIGSYVKKFNLHELGFSAEVQEQLEQNSKKPFGMIVTAGPTGSGKTTTLYAMMKKLANSGINITTIEDPIEYQLQGANQIQVDRRNDLDFATGLRAIVRQDPDVILVGEIRDEETAEISVNAALTGHQLLTSFHANDAITTIIRLADMGIEPFLLASTLQVVVAQRLVRTLHQPSRQSYILTRQQFDEKYPGMGRYFPGNQVTLYRATPSDVAPDGFKGRTAVVEMLNVTQELQDIIMQKPSVRTLQSYAHKHRMRTMFEDGISKVKAGITTLEELTRVVPQPLPTATIRSSKRKA